MKHVAILMRLAVILLSGMLAFSWAQTAAPAAKSDTAMHTGTAKTNSGKVKLKPQTTCPVLGDPIDKSLYVDYKGKRIYVCCEGCIDSVKSDPEKYIKKLKGMGQDVETIKSSAKKEPSKDPDMNGMVKSKDTSMKGMNMKGMDMGKDTATKGTDHSRMKMENK